MQNASGGKRPVGSGPGFVVTALTAGVLGAGGVLLGTTLGQSESEKVTALEERIAVAERSLADLAERQAPSTPTSDTSLGELTSALLGGLTDARLDANETACIATLRNVVSAQAQFQASGKADEDEDGVGEYGGFLELSGGAAGRLLYPLSPAVLSGPFRALDEQGILQRNGYRFRMILADRDGGGVSEPGDGFRAGMGLDPDLGERVWCLYAWPKSESSGTRTFFTNQWGDVLSTEDPRYPGSMNGPAADAAFREVGTITGEAKADVEAADGNRWKQVN